MRKKDMKLLAVVTMVTCGIGLATYSFGAAPHKIKYTVHNLGATSNNSAPRSGAGVKGPNYSEDTTQICVFCHTPHNAVDGKRFLWNRPGDSATPTTFRQYTGSPTLTAASRAAVVGDVSKFCLTCHDGVTALSAVQNKGGDASVSMYGGGEWMSIGNDPFVACGATPAGQSCGTGPNIGGGATDWAGGWDTYRGDDLTNDHPIGIDYEAAQGEDAKLRSLAEVESSELRLWYGKVECPTCHDPHVNYGYPVGWHNSYGYDPLTGGDATYAPFLRRTNESSGLCLTCHDK